MAEKNIRGTDVRNWPHALHLFPLSLLFRRDALKEFGKTKSRKDVVQERLPTRETWGWTPRARKPEKKEMRRAEKESLDREKTLNSERVRKQCVGKR